VPARSPWTTSVESGRSLRTLTCTSVPVSARSSGPGMRGAPQSSANASTVTVESTRRVGCQAADRATRRSRHTPPTSVPPGTRLSLGTTGSAARSCAAGCTRQGMRRRVGDARERLERVATVAPPAGGAHLEGGRDLRGPILKAAEENLSARPSCQVGPHCPKLQAIARRAGGESPVDPVTLARSGLLHPADASVHRTQRAGDPLSNLS